MEMAIPASDMMFDERPMKCIGMKASRTETGIVMMGTMADGMCQRNTRMTRLTIADLEEQLVLEVVDRTLDQLRAVVGGDDAHALRKRGLHLLEARLDAVDDLARVLAVAHDDDAAHGIALAVEIRDAAPDLGSERDRCRRPGAAPACRARPS